MLVLCRKDVLCSYVRLRVNPELAEQLKEASSSKSEASRTSRARATWDAEMLRSGKSRDVTRRVT